ncbi:MAG: hypothetical protein ACR2GW_12835 [Pyrinomonadaceae bacterium]
MRESYEGFREDAIEEIEKRCASVFKEWSFDLIYSDVIQAFNLDDKVRGKGYPRGCSALAASLINIVRAARYQMRRVDDWNRQQQMKARDR